MEEILKSLKMKSAEMRVEANLGNTPTNQAWFEYRIHFLDGFDSAISSIENMLTNSEPTIRRSIPSTLASQVIPVEHINNHEYVPEHQTNDFSDACKHAILNGCNYRDCISCKHCEHMNVDWNTHILCPMCDASRPNM